MNLYNVIDTTLESKNSSRFRKNISKRIYKLIMTTNDKTIDEKLQYNINREAYKKSVLSATGLKPTTT